MTIRHLLWSFIVLSWLLPQNVLAQNYTIINDASVYSGCNCYRLTPAVNNQGGGVYQNNTINLNNSFDYTFNVFLGCNGSGGADGIVFILTNNITGIGAQGGGLGYSGLPGNSFAVEYDTWQNSQDPSYDHIAMESGGSVNHNVAGPVSALASQSNIDNCAWHTTEIIWDVNTQTYSVYFDGVLRLTYTGNIVANFFGGNPVVNWGWSGSTGGGNNDQRFCVTTISNWVAGTNYQSCSLTMQFHDISTSNVGPIPTWAWNFGDPASGAANTSTVQNPTHTYSGNGTYTVTLTITDNTGCATTYSHTVTINAPITLSANLVEPPCNGGNNGNIYLTPSGGFGPGAGYGGYTYTWSNNASNTSSQDIGLTSGTFNVTVTDGVCTSTASYTLNQPPPLTAVTSHTDAPCGANGSVSLTISGGTPPYYGPSGAPQLPVWNGVPGYNQSGLPPAVYVADFDDSHGCSALLTYRETIASLPCGYTVSTSSTDVTCFGGSNGTATLTVTGGTNPKVVSWTNSAGTTVSNVANATGLPADTYTYHYSDGSGQVFTGTVVVNQPGGALVASISTTGTTCSYLNNGSAVASVTANGTPNYNYVWSSPGQPNSATATGLGAGPISVTITDQNNCTATASGTVAGQTLLSASVTTVPDSCYLAHKGSATVTATGGTPVYSYLWSNSPTAIGSTDYGIGFGNYTVTVTDQNNCTATASGSVSQPPNLTETISQVNVLCFGGNTGSATITPAGGNGGYTYSWNNGPVTATNSPLVANKYYVTVTDMKFCTVSDSVTITQPAAAFQVTETHVNVKCKGSSTGSITLTESGGTTPYATVTWADGPTGTSRINLPAGNYTYSALDANNCSATGTITITEPATVFTITPAHVDVLCFGNNTGSITLTLAGGTTPYAIPVWSDLATGSTRSNLIAGTYNYIDTDNNGCIASGSVIIAQPASAFSVTETHVNVLCKGGATGTINLTETGGTTPYGTVTWSDGPTTGTSRINLIAGNYTYTAKDANNCSATATIIITEPAAAFQVTETHVNVKCKGSSTGSITLTETGGTTPYATVTWADGPTGTSRTNLPAGNYTYSALDANNCTATGTITITEPATVFTITPAHVDVLCFGGNTGSITLTLAGGTTPYAVPVWSDLATGSTRSNLIAGTYNYIDTDNNGCIASGSVIIGQPASAFSVTETHVDVLCKGGATGGINLTETGGTTPYGTVTWSDGPTTGTSRINLIAGNYTYTATDANNCSATATIIIAEPAAAFQVTETHVNVLCKGSSTGSITLTETGGTTPYATVTWADGPTGTSRTNLPAGNYTYSALDANNCSATGTITITEPATNFTITPTHVDVLCFGNNTGSITLTPAGGTTPYATPWWSDLATGFTRNNLIAGTYNYTDSDNNGCLVTGSVIIGQPATGGMTVNVTPTNATCSYSSDGSALASVVGGVSPYNYGWSNTFTETGVITSTATGLSAITYTVTVTDQNSCTALGSTTIGSQPRITAQLAVTDVNCFGGNTGAINVTAGGGVGGFHYTWSANAATGDQPNAGNLAAALYNLTITDGNNCVLDTFATVAQPASALSYSLPVFVHNVSCNGGNDGEIKYVVSGGTAPYGFTWSGSAAGSNDSAINLIAGSYDVTITDANSCVVNNTVAVSEPTALSIVSQSQTNVSCNGGNNGTATVNVTGGTSVAGYTYTWNPNAGSTNAVSSLVAGPYSVIVTDDNHCAITANFNISEPLALTASAVKTDVLCNNGSTGSVTVTAGGGTPASTGYVYTWNPNVSTTNIGSSLTAGPYSITVTDSLQCTTVTSALVGEPSALLPIVVSKTDVSCSRDSNGQVQFSASGGIPPYQYAISPDGVNYSANSTSGAYTDLKIGTYTGRVTDANGCTSTVTTSIIAPDSVTVTYVIDTVKCYGEQNGGIEVSATGGTPGYTFTFSNGVINNSGNNLSLIAGTYGFTVTDSRGCAQTYTTVIDQPDSLEIFCTPARPVIDLTESIDLQATSNAGTNIVFTWTPSIGLSNTTGSNTTVTTYNSQTYTLTGTINPHGEACVATIQVPVTVVPTYNVFVPNSFTPNGDGINDYFEIYGNKKSFKFVEVEIYDRWGEKVFQSNDIDFKWDGKYNGTLVEPNAFVYQIAIVFVDNHSNGTYKGTLTVLR